MKRDTAILKAIRYAITRGDTITKDFGGDTVSTMAILNLLDSEWDGSALTLRTKLWTKPED